MKKYPKCKYCNEPVITPFEVEAHFACSAKEFFADDINFNTRNVTFREKKLLADEAKAHHIPKHY